MLGDRATWLVCPFLGCCCASSLLFYLLEAFCAIRTPFLFVKTSWCCCCKSLAWDAADHLLRAGLGVAYPYPRISAIVPDSFQMSRTRVGQCTRLFDELESNVPSSCCHLWRKMWVCLFYVCFMSFHASLVYTSFSPNEDLGDEQKQAILNYQIWPSR